MGLLGRRLGVRLGPRAAVVTGCSLGRIAVAAGAGRIGRLGRGCSHLVVGDRRSRPVGFGRSLGRTEELVVRRSLEGDV